MDMDLDSIAEVISAVRWANGFCCPRCGNDKSYKSLRVLVHECARCRYQASITAGTFIHGSRLPLLTWLVAMKLMQQYPALSIKDFAARLGLSYKTAWLLHYKIAKALELDDALAKALFDWLISKPDNEL